AVVTSNAWTTSVPKADLTHAALPDGSYTVTANVSDAAGNPATPATQTLTVAETPPTVTISAADSDGDNVINYTEAQRGVPLSGTVTGVAPETKFDITATDGSFSHSYQATVNAAGTAWTASMPPGHAKMLADGTLTVTAQVTDQYGNQSALATQTFTVAETLPTVTINTAAGGGDNVINHTEAQNGETLGGTVTGLAANSTFSITATDGTFSGTHAATVNGTGTGWSATIPSTDATKLADGATALTVTAQGTDQYGNQSALAAQTFRVAQTLPTVTVNATDNDGDGVINHTEAQNGVTLSGTVSGIAAHGTFSITVTDGTFSETYTATVNGDGNGWTATIPSSDATTLADGTAALTVSAQVTDQYGNQSAVATQAFTVDTDANELVSVALTGLTSGYALEDQKITATVTDSDNDIPATGVSYTWQASHDGASSWSTVGSNSNNYTPSEADEGGLLKVMASFTDASGNSETGSMTVGVLPLLTIADTALSVTPNGSVALGIGVVQEPTPDDALSVTISFKHTGHAPTITAGDHATGDPDTSHDGTTYPSSATDVSSGLTFNNHGNESDTLTVEQILNGNTVATTQTITVTDPPISDASFTIHSGETVDLTDQSAAAVTFANNG